MKHLYVILSAMLILVITGSASPDSGYQTADPQYYLIESGSETENTENIHNSLDNDVYFNILHDRQVYCKVLLSGLSRTMTNPFIQEIFQPPKAA